MEGFIYNVPFMLALTLGSYLLGVWVKKKSGLLRDAAEGCGLMIRPPASGGRRNKMPSHRRQRGSPIR